MPEKKVRKKIFKGGKKPVNVDLAIFKKIEKDASEKNLYPSQIMNEILKKHYENL